MRADRPSETAQLIALATIVLDSDPRRRHLVAPEAAEWSRLFLEVHPPGRRAVSWAQRGWTRGFWAVAERLAWPGLSEHFWHRKQWIEARVRAALNDGWRRILIAGAGLDTLALRLAPEFPAVEFVELDHPATRRMKLKAMAKARREIPKNLRFLESDLADGTLPAECVEPGSATVTVAEGLLMYLRPEVVRRFLRSAALLPKARLVFSFMTGAHVLGPIVQLKLKLRGEPFLWSISPVELPGLLGECGLRLRAQASGADLAAAAGGTAFDGEDLAECERLAPA